MVKLATSWQKASSSSSTGFKGDSRKNTHIFGSLCLSLCDKHHGQKKPVEKKVYFSLQLQALMKGVRRGTQAEAVEERCLSACSPWLTAQPASYTTQAHSPGAASPTVIWAFPHQSPMKKMLLPPPPKPPQGLLTENLMEALSQLRFLFPGNSSLCQVQGKETPLELKKGPYGGIFPISVLAFFITPPSKTDLL